MKYLLSSTVLYCTGKVQYTTILTTVLCCNHSTSSPLYSQYGTGSTQYSYSVASKIGALDAERRLTTDPNCRLRDDQLTMAQDRTAEHNNQPAKRLNYTYSRLYSSDPTNLQSRTGACSVEKGGFDEL